MADSGSKVLPSTRKLYHILYGHIVSYITIQVIPMENLLHIRSEFMPSIERKAFRVLSMLADGKQHTKFELMSVIGDDPRSALQWLQGKPGGFWLIHNDSAKHQPAVYRLDAFHLSGSLIDDASARRVQQAKYKGTSRLLAEKNARRLATAIAEYQDAVAGLSESEAANDASWIKGLI